jgi:nicotinamidase/pyrazinamidase
MNNTAVIAIDFQIDFCDLPGSPLQVPGAVKDIERACALIERINPEAIYASQDSHYVLDISHPSWWQNAQGKPVGPFTPISSAQVRNGEFNARVQPGASLAYVEALEQNGEFQHFIWPEHCIVGSTGHAFHPDFLQTLNAWSAKNLRWVHLIRKGLNPMTEHFGIFRANVPNADPATQVSQAIFSAFQGYDQILIVGEALRHCVFNSVRQMLQIAPQLAPKMLIVEDCMSPVQGLPDDFNNGVDNEFESFKAQGVRFVKSTDL